MVTPEIAEIDAVRTDGGQVRIRPVADADADALRALVQRASDRSVFFRFFSLNRAAAEHYTEGLVDANTVDRRALVAVAGDQLVAVAGYERMDADSAEVALQIDDGYQGEGIGTLLLEHLVSAARQAGIKQFVAEALLENTAVIEVLHDLGYATTQTGTGAEVHIVCSLEPDEATQRAVDERDRISAVNSLRPILAPRSIAVIGASSRPRSVGRELLHSIHYSGFTGPIYPVNPKHHELLGIKAYPSVADLPEAPDLAVIAVPSAGVAEVVRQCGERGVRGLVLVTSGFREMAGEGGAREADVVAIARHYGMRLIGPNCLGIVNSDPAVRLGATFAPMPMHPGGFGLASQSGALGIAVALDADRLGVGLSQFISLGNKADVSANDLLMWWEDDPNTSVIGLYLESFGNPRKFARIGRRVSRVKPVLAIKSGRSDAGQRAGKSHTAAAATSDHFIDALCAQANVLRVDTIEQFIDAARVFTTQPLPAGPRVGIVGNSGGPEILAADAATAAGLTVPVFSEETAAAIRAAAPSPANASNPVDLGGDMTPAALSAAIDVVLGSGEVDALLVVVAPTVAVSAEEANATVCAHKADIPVLVTTLGAEPPARSGVPVPFEFPEPAAYSLGLMWRYAQSQARPEGSMWRPDDIDRAAAEAALLNVADDGWLQPSPTSAVLGAYGLITSPQAVVRDVRSAVAAADDFGYPVVLKAVGLLHKTDVGGVRLDLRDQHELRAAYSAMAEVADSFLIQPMAHSGVELIVGAVQHAQFGPLVMLGAGGVFADLFGDRQFRLAPMTDVDAEAMVNGVSRKLLDGFRGGAPVNRRALSELVQRVSLLVAENPDIVELDLNPVIASGDQLIVVDAKVHVGNTVPLPDPLARRLSTPRG